MRDLRAVAEEVLSLDRADSPCDSTFIEHAIVHYAELARAYLEALECLTEAHRENLALMTEPRLLREKYAALVRDVRAAGFVAGGSLEEGCRYCGEDVDYSTESNAAVCAHAPDCLWLRLAPDPEEPQP